jgi:hypothetical protein
VKISKLKTRRGSVVRITYERDHDHEAWFSDGSGVPTPQTVPDAFYPVHSPAYPVASAASSRQAKPRTLSRKALRRRLYQAGLQGARLNETANAILKGPAIEDMQLGVMVLRWNVETFKTRFGRRVARAILRAVSTYLLMVDEAHSLLSANSEWATRALSMFRKHNSVVVPAEQDLSKLEALYANH